MRRDSLFYRLFQQSPSLLFDLLGDPPPNATTYRFDSVAVKEPKFEIDGVFLPPESDIPGTVYFCEVQFQRDDLLYERLFSESLLYFYRQHQRFSDWQTVVIYPTRSTEQPIRAPYQDLLNGQRVHRIFLEDLGEPQALPLGLGVMVLTTVTPEQAAEQARELITRTQQEIADPQNQQAIIDLITTIMVYRFTQLSRQEVEAMLGLRLEDSRVYQEAKAEGLQQGIQEGLQQGIQEGLQQGIQEGLQQGIQEGLQQGIQEGIRTGRVRQANLVLRQLQHKLGEVPPALASILLDLDFAELDILGEAIFDVESLADVVERLVIRVSSQTSIATVQVDKLLQVLTVCLGSLEPSVSEQIKTLSISQVQKLAQLVLGWQSARELQAWLDTSKV